MNGFDTGYCDEQGRKFLVGSKVEWKDSEGWTCRGDIILKDGCMIGVDSWEGFVLVKDFGHKYRVVDYKEQIDNTTNEINYVKMKEIFQSIGDAISFSAYDWASNQRHAWIYGIVKGWTDGGIKELQNEFGWNDETVKRLKSYHAEVKNVMEKS